MSIGFDPSQFQTAASSYGSSSQSTSPFRSLANLSLTDDQRSKIRSIFANAASQELSPSDVTSQIESVLTPTQQTQFANAQNNSTSFTGSSLTASTSGTSNTSVPNLFTALNLSTAQQSQIASILSSAQGSTPSQVQTQIKNVLTSTQQTELQQEIAQGPSSSGSSGSNIPQQILAANNLNQQQRQFELHDQGSSGVGFGQSGAQPSGPPLGGPPPGAGGSADSSAINLVQSSSSSGTSNTSSSVSGTSNTSSSVSGTSNTSASLASLEAQQIKEILADLENALTDLADQSSTGTTNISSTITAGTSSSGNSNSGWQSQILDAFNSTQQQVPGSTSFGQSDSNGYSSGYF